MENVNVFLDALSGKKYDESWSKVTIIDLSGWKITLFLSMKDANAKIVRLPVYGEPDDYDYKFDEADCLSKLFFHSLLRFQNLQRIYMPPRVRIIIRDNDLVRSFECNDTWEIAVQTIKDSVPSRISVMDPNGGFLHSREASFMRVHGVDLEKNTWT